MTSVTVYGYSLVLLFYVRVGVPLVYRYFYLITRLNKTGVIYWYGIWVSQCLYHLIHPTNGTLWWFHNYPHILIFPLWHQNIFVITEVSHWYQFTKKKNCIEITKILHLAWLWLSTGANIFWENRKLYEDRVTLYSTLADFIRQSQKWKTFQMNVFDFYDKRFSH